MDVVVPGRELSVDYAMGILPDGREAPFNCTYTSEGVLIPGSSFIETWVGGKRATRAPASASRCWVAPCRLQRLVVSRVRTV